MSDTVTYFYRPLLRPASFATLPRGLAWSFVEAPWSLADRLALPRCDTPHGLIATDRPLTVAECACFDLKAEDGSTPWAECHNCGDVLVSVRAREDGVPHCDRCWRSALEYGHRHGLHDEKTDLDVPVPVEGCPVCAGLDPVRDALYTALCQLTVEHGAATKCRALGQVDGDFDLRVARSEIARLELLVTRLRARLEKGRA